MLTDSHTIAIPTDKPYRFADNAYVRPFVTYTINYACYDEDGNYTGTRIADENVSIQDMYYEIDDYGNMYFNDEEKDEFIRFYLDKKY